MNNFCTMVHLTNPMTNYDESNDDSEIVAYIVTQKVH